MDIVDRLRKDKWHISGVDAEEAASEIERLRTGDTCGRMCEGTAYRIEARRLLERNEMLEQGARRYELLRTLSAHEFAELYRANISGAGRFDDLVDDKVRERAALKTPNV